jgi:PTS system trehalose-specific IIC component
MGKYRDDAEKLLEYVGGKENIAAVTHCATTDAICAERSVKS